MENNAHIAYLRTYAEHSDHPAAPEVCRLARVELLQNEDAMIEPTTSKMLDDLTVFFGSTATLQLKISELIVADPGKWRMEAVAELWKLHCAPAAE